MTFFGLTFLGYQYPFREQRLELAKIENEFHFFFFPSSVGTPTPKLELFYPKLPPIGPGGYYDTGHQGSHRKYQESIRRVKLQKNPNQIYRMPLTCGQDIGWWLPKEPSIRPEVAMPWMRAQRHPPVPEPHDKVSIS
ncbi:hypothetical protein lerEdw1_001574 [Lerista edwardsae]|nr:hypothetical protein lerEdw1_001574 [Lerista edwardsae]